MTTATKTEQLTAPGTRVCTVGRDGSRCADKYNVIFTGKVYEARRRADGILTWRLIDTFGGTRAAKRPSAKFVAELQDRAEHPWVSSLASGEVCK